MEKVRSIEKATHWILKAILDAEKEIVHKLFETTELCLKIEQKSMEIDTI